MLLGLELLLELRQRSVAQLGDPVEIVLTLGLFDLHLRLFDLLAQRAQLDRGVLLRVPARAQPRLILAQRRQLFLQLLEPAAARVVVLLAQRLALDLELHDAARDLVELLRHRVDLGAQLRGRLVDQVDRLVGQEAVGDVAVAQRRGRDERAVLDAHAVMRLVLLFQAAQDRDRVLDAGLIDHDRLEAPLQRRILLDVLAVFVERRRADHVQLAAREHRLEQVARVHRAFGLARADDGVQLVDEQDDLAFRSRDVFEHRLEPLFELAAILRAGDQRAHVERDDALVLQSLGDVAAHDALREALRRSPSCRRRDRRSAPDCSSCGARALGRCAESLRRARSPDRVCRAPPRA